MNFTSTIGLEVHFELKTKSKIFSPSPVTYGAKPNTEPTLLTGVTQVPCQWLTRKSTAWA